MTDTPLPGDEGAMRLALQLACRALDEGEIPVGAVVLAGGRVIGKGYNQTQRLRDVTAHAEMLALTAAAAHLGGKYLPGCTLYVTLEPCVMCAGALFWAQVDRIVYATADPKRGYARTQAPLLHPRTRVTAGVLAAESEALLKAFFGRLRGQ